MTRILSILAGAALLVPSLFVSALAQDEHLVGDAEAGAGKIATCMACHGQDGIGTLPENPTLAGQVPGYIKQQLEAFQSGERENAVMMGMVDSLTPQDMADIDAYYSSQPGVNGSITPDLEETALAGRKIYRAGIAEFEIPACMSCHLPDGAGIAPDYPRLAGLSGEYLKTQLEAFKSGDREHDMMNPIAFPLSEEQIQQLAIFISGLN